MSADPKTTLRTTTSIKLKHDPFDRHFSKEAQHLKEL
jgi:hypothetical protein